jgi:hypothetical protein
MTLTALVFGGICFGAGICAGVYLNEKDIVNCQHLRQGGEKLVAGARVLITYVKKEMTSESAAETSPVPAS